MSWWDVAADAVQHGLARVDEAAAARCLRALRESPCGVTVDELDILSDLADCNAVFVGTRVLGGACDPAIWNPCATGTVCASNETCAGRCAPAGAEGETCARRPCAPELVCSGDALCVRGGADGASCDASRPCAAWLGCRDGVCGPQRTSCPGECPPGSRCEAGACVGDAALGEACTYASCVHGLRCDVATSTCAELGHADESCGTSQDCASDAPYCVRIDEDSVCSESPDHELCFAWHGVGSVVVDSCADGLQCPSLSGRCVRKAPIGEPCGERGACVDGARCVEDRCRAIALPGETCGEIVVCPTSHRCDGTRCVARPVIGEACTDVCLSGSCVGGVCTLREDGEPCDEWLHSVATECVHACIEGVCATAEPIAEGSDCTYRCGDDLACVLRDGDARACLACPR